MLIPATRLVTAITSAHVGFVLFFGLCSRNFERARFAPFLFVDAGPAKKRCSRTASTEVKKKNASEAIYSGSFVDNLW